MPVTIKETTEWTVVTPEIPAFIECRRHIPPNGLDTKQVSISDLSDEDLYAIGNEWRDQFVKLAKSKRSPE